MGIIPWSVGQAHSQSFSTGPEMHTNFRDRMWQIFIFIFICIFIFIFAAEETEPLLGSFGRNWMD